VARVEEVGEGRMGVRPVTLQVLGQYKGAASLVSPRLQFLFLSPSSPPACPSSPPPPARASSSF